MTRGGYNYHYYYHADGLGSITAITDSTGATVNTYRYDAFGNIVSQTGTLANPYTYTGRELDAETSLYYYRARYYDARVGRFLQEDPINNNGNQQYLALNLPYPQRLNSYVIVSNNPLILIDPFGLQCVPLGQQFLRNLAQYSFIAGVGTALAPPTQPASIVFMGIAAGATGLEISIYSKEPVRDIVKETIKALIGEKAGNIGSMFTDQIIEDMTTQKGDNK